MRHLSTTVDVCPRRAVQPIADSTSQNARRLAARLGEAGNLHPPTAHGGGGQA
jgi:hypothetical protein